jgi:hypothetical protein
MQRGRLFVFSGTVGMLYAGWGKKIRRAGIEPAISRV